MLLNRRSSRFCAKTTRSSTLRSGALCLMGDIRFLATAAGQQTRSSTCHCRSSCGTCARSTRTTGVCSTGTGFASSSKPSASSSTTRCFSTSKPSIVCWGRCGRMKLTWPTTRRRSSCASTRAWARAGRRTCGPPTLKAWTTPRPGPTTESGQDKTRTFLAAW